MSARCVESIPDRARTAIGSRRFRSFGAVQSARRALPPLLALLASIFAARAPAGEEYRDWTRDAPIPGRGRSGADGLPRGGTERHEQVGEVSTLEGPVALVRFVGGERAVETRPQIGDKVYVGDLFSVGGEGVLEVTLGHNARLRIGADSRVRVAGMTTTGDADDDVVTTKRDVEIQKGSARVRVKKNVRTPAPVFVITGNAALLLQRSDAVVRTEKKRSTVMVLQGKADVMLKTYDAAGWEVGRTIPLEEKQKLTVDEGVGEEDLAPQAMDPVEIERARGALSFSVDEFRRRLPPPPPHSRELDGP